MDSPPFVGGRGVGYVLLILFGFLCFLLFVFVLCLVSTVAHVSGLSILDCPFGFLKRVLHVCSNTLIMVLIYF